LNYYGTRESAIINNFLVVSKLMILGFFCIYGALFIKAGNFLPFLPLDGGVFFGAYYIFFAFGGFARVAVVAEEVKDAKRNVPRAMLLSLVISTVFYIAVGLIAVGLVGASVLSSSNSPLKTAIGATGSSGAAYLVSLGGLLATASVLLTSILGVSRMAYAMAKRDALPPILSRLDKKYNTPSLSIWITGAVMAVLVLTINLSSVIVISTFAMLFYYATANISAWRLKDEHRNYPKLVPVIGAFSCIGLLVFVLFVSLQAWIIGTLGLLAGAIFYVANRRLGKGSKA
jgi:APA family basic amino acid/polyamine antiporter